MLNPQVKDTDIEIIPIKYNFEKGIKFKLNKKNIIKNSKNKKGQNG
jgi:hypothetical protein